MPLNLVQKFDVEIDSKELLKKYLELAIPTVLNSVEEIAVKVIEHNDKRKKLYYPSAIYSDDSVLPILLVEGWYKQDSKKNSFFNGYKPWELFEGESALKNSIEYIMAFLDKNLNELTERFFEECGDGHNGFDGTILSGFKLLGNNTFPNSLSLSIVHIYYGK